MHRVEGEDDARRLAQRLNDSSRERPVVVVSTPAGRRAPFIDADQVADEVGDVVEVHLISTGPVSWAFSKQMAEGTQVYGGAGRVYPVGLEWVTHLHRSPLRFAYDEAEGSRAMRALVSDALSMASAAGLVGRTAKLDTLPSRGRVIGVVAGRALVDTPSGPATIIEELTVVGVPLERVVAPGMAVTGHVDPLKRLDISQMLLSAGDALASYRRGDVVLARVDEIRADSVVLSLHPDLQVAVQRADVTSNDLDDLRTLMSTGEVIRARVTDVDPFWRLTLADLDDDDDAAPAASLIRGGPSWLSEQAAQDPPTTAPPPVVTSVAPPAEAAVAEAVAPVGPSPAMAPPTPAIFDGLRRQPAAEPPPAAEPATATAEPAPAQRPVPKPVPLRTTQRLEEELRRARDEARLCRETADGLRGELDLLLQQHYELRRRVDEQDGQLRAARTSLRKAKGRSRADGDRDHAWFADPEEQFRYDVHQAWVRRIPAAEKADRALPDYLVGPDFIRSVRQIQGVHPEKVADVVMEVLTGLATRLAGRETHELRTDAAGGSPKVVREDGAVCWRVSLQRNTPSARRLHYWKLPDGTVELSRVVLHDHFAP